MLPLHLPLSPFPRLIFRLLVLVMCLLPAGCASVSRLRPVVGPERDQARQGLQRMLGRQAVCAVGVDAQATVTLHSFLRDITLSGYLQAMAPASLRFTALGPLDQPMVLFASDGQEFRLVMVPEAVGYEGAVSGATFASYAPQGMRPESLYYWLIGAIEPGDLRLLEVRAAEDGHGYWFDLRQGDEALVFHRLLLDEATGLVATHLLMDEDDGVLFSARYDALPVDGPCCLPRGLIMEAPPHGVTMTFSFADCLADRKFTSADFQLSLPSVYRKVTLP